MQLIFVRHAEPDYSVDSLTPKGFREAELLARRTAAWRPTACFCSPAGRAQATAKPSLAAMGVEAETLEWMAEFTIGCHARPDGSGDQSWVPWDLFPDYWTADPRYNDPEGWLDTPYLQAHADVARPRWAEIKAGIDGVLARYGYRREANHYRIAPDARTVCGEQGGGIEHRAVERPVETLHEFLYKEGVRINMFTGIADDTSF